MKNLLAFLVLISPYFSTCQTGSTELPEPTLYDCIFRYGTSSEGGVYSEVLMYRVRSVGDTSWYFMGEEVFDPKKIKGLGIIAHQLEYGNKIFKCYDKEGNYKYLQYPFYKTAASNYDATIKRKTHQDSKGDWYHTYHLISTDSIPNYFTEYDDNVGSFVLTNKKYN